MGNPNMGPESTKVRKKMLEQFLNDGGNTKLPSEIIIEILSWLSVKSLCRFRCVSKPWKSLISDGDFVKMHYEDVFYQRRRLTFCGPDGYFIQSVDLDQLIPDPNDAFLSHDHEIDDLVVPEVDLVKSDELPCDMVEDLFYCNGLLVCKLYGQKWLHELYLVNPATGESKKLPEGPECMHHMGCGFDQSSDDYKVVCQLFCEDGFMFSVYSLKTDSWRVVQCPLPYTGAFNAHGILINGGLHWLMANILEERMIVSFLLAEEKAREIPLLLECSNDVGPSLLGVSRECLCLTYNGPEKIHDEFWIMKEYGMRQSWTKIKISIPYSNLYHSGFWKKNLDLFGLRRTIGYVQFQGRKLLYSIDF